MSKKEKNVALSGYSGKISRADGSIRSQTTSIGREYMHAQVAQASSAMALIFIILDTTLTILSYASSAIPLYLIGPMLTLHLTIALFYIPIEASCGKAKYPHKSHDVAIAESYAQRNKDYGTTQHNANTSGSLGLKQPASRGSAADL